MSKLISGKEALIALANGEDVQSLQIGLYGTSHENWLDLYKTRTLTVFDFISGKWCFRLKPRTITINGIEVPAPFEPKEDGIFYILDDGCSSGYRTYAYEVDADAANLFFGLWRTEEEIKQVVAALRQVFNVQG